MMDVGRNLCLCSLVAVLCILFLGIAVPAETIDTVLGTVNGVIITLSEYEDRLSEYSELTNSKVITPMIKEHILQNLITEGVLLSLLPDTPDVRERVTRLAKQTVRTELDQIAAGEKQSNLADLPRSEAEEILLPEKRRITAIMLAHQQLMMKENLRSITRNEQEQYLRDHPEIKFGESRISVDLIYVSEANEGDRQNALSKALRILKRALLKEDFGKLAREYSQHEVSRQKDGNLGEIIPGDFPELDCLFDLESGQVYPELIPFGQGWGIFRVRQRLDLSQIIKEQIVQEKAEKKLRQLISEADVQINLDLLPGVSYSKPLVDAE